MVYQIEVIDGRSQVIVVSSGQIVAGPFRTGVKLEFVALRDKKGDRVGVKCYWDNGCWLEEGSTYILD
jgi:hypothetical protein